MCKYFATGPSKLIQQVPTNLSMSRSQLMEQICRTRISDWQEWQCLVVLNGTKIFLNGTNIFFLKFICGILNRGVANSFWNHMITNERILSSMHFYIFLTATKEQNNFVQREQPCGTLLQLVLS
jgi:hypothetical protein